MYEGPYLQVELLKRVNYRSSVECLPRMSKALVQLPVRQKKEKLCSLRTLDSPFLGCTMVATRSLGSSLSSDKPSCPAMPSGSDHHTVSCLQPVPLSRGPHHHLPQAPRSLKRLPRSPWACLWKAAKRISSLRVGPAPPWVGSPSQAARLQGASRRWWPCPQSWTHTPSPRGSRRSSLTTT